MGTPAAVMTCFAKDLEPSIIAAPWSGPKHRTPAARTASATPGDQRSFRADHDEVRRCLGGQRRDLAGVGRRDRVQLRDLSDTGVAWRGVQLSDRRVPGQGPGERVLTAARAEE